MTVSVGFAPATTPGVVTGGTTAAPETDAPEGLFAALLAIVAPAADAEIAELPDTITSAEFAALVQKVAPNVAGISDGGEAEDASTADPVADASPIAELPRTEQGKSLLKDLGAALIAINDALEAGKPVDPALEKKLGDAVDAVAAYLGVAIAPPAPTVHPRISALASGDGILPAATPAELPPAAPVPADAPAVDPVQPTLEAPVAPVALPVAAPAGEPVESDDLAADPSTLLAPITEAPEATTLEEAPPALRELGVLIGKLSTRLEPTDPVLAKKLAALAEGLQSGTASDELLAALGIDDAAGDPDLDRIIAALSAPKPAAKPAAAEAQPFIAPTLVLPETKAKATEATPPPAPAPAKLEAAPVEVAKPAPVPVVERDSKPADNAPPPAASTAASSDASAQPDAVTAATQQPATAPVARTIHAAYQAPMQQVNLPQVAFEIVRQFDAGNSRFQIRLDPPELGRIDVRLDVDKSGTVNARMVVERPETLDLMQRDQRALQQALQQAGLDASRTNLEFSLRQNPFAAQGGMGDGRGQQPAFGTGDTLGSEETGTEAATPLYRGTATAGGVNLFV